MPDGVTEVVVTDAMVLLVELWSDEELDLYGTAGIDDETDFEILEEVESVVTLEVVEEVFEEVIGEVVE